MDGQSRLKLKIGELTFAVAFLEAELESISAQLAEAKKKTEPVSEKPKGDAE